MDLCVILYPDVGSRSTGVVVDFDFLNGYTLDGRRFFSAYPHIESLLGRQRSFRDRHKAEVPSCLTIQIGTTSWKHTICQKEYGCISIIVCSHSNR